MTGQDYYVTVEALRQLTLRYGAALIPSIPSCITPMDDARSSDIGSGRRNRSNPPTCLKKPS